MDLLSLSQLLDLAIGTPEVGAVNFVALHSLLQAMLQYLGLQDLPAQKPEHSSTLLPWGAHPGLEKEGDGATDAGQLPEKDALQETVSALSLPLWLLTMKAMVNANDNSIFEAMALPQTLLEEINEMKTVQSRMGEDIQEIKEVLGLGKLQEAAGQLPGRDDQTTSEGDVERLGLYPAPEEVSTLVHSGVLEDCLVGGKAAEEEEEEEEGGSGQGLPVESAGAFQLRKQDQVELQPPATPAAAGPGTAAEEGGGGQSASAELATSDMDAPHGASSALGTSGPGTPETSEEAPGTKPGTPGAQAGTENAPVTPEKLAGTPSDQTKTSGVSATTLGVQPGSPSTETSIPGMQPGTPSTETSMPGMQPGSPSTETSIPGMQPGTPSTETSMPGMQLGTPSTETSMPGMQLGTPSTETSMPGMQAGSLGTETSMPGMQLGTPSTETSTPGMQPGSPGTETSMPGMQPGSPGTETSMPGMQAGSLGTETIMSGMQAGSLGTETSMPGMQPGSPSTETSMPGMQPGSLGTETSMPGMQPGSPSTETSMPGMQPGSLGSKTSMLGMQLGSPSTETSIPEMQAGSLGTETSMPGMQPGTPSTETSVLGVQPGIQGGGAGVQPTPTGMKPSLPGADGVPTKATPGALGTEMNTTSPKDGGKGLPITHLAQADHLATGTLSQKAQVFESPLDADPRATSRLQELAVPLGSSGSSSTSGHYAENMEALRQIRQLGQLHAALKEQVAQLEATKLDRTELHKQHLLFSEGDQESITNSLADLWGQVSSLQGLASELQSEKEKIRQLENTLKKLDMAGADVRASCSNEISLQLGSMLQEIKKELGNQQEMSKATLQQFVTKTAGQLQEQMDKLKAVVKSTDEERAGAQSTCAACSMDTSVQLGQLLQRYEKLQELVDSFMSRQAASKVVRQLPRRSQEEALLKHIQATITQLQGDNEKLNSIMRSLLDDCRQKDKDIEALFESLKRMENEKADKEDLELGFDVKATLASKVNRTQFDATMERLNETMQDMLDRVMGQEQVWHQMQQQLIEKMDSKLDYVELGPFRQQLEEHWKCVVDQLKKELPTEPNDAAGLKKQLLAHFHCLSCDRPLDMLVPGPQNTSIPSMPPLAPRPAGSPQAIFKPEQTQQLGHSQCRYPSVPRQCGGRHTLMNPLQRPPRFQLFPSITPRPVQPLILFPIQATVTEDDKMELLDEGGRMHRGRPDGQLPPLVGEEGFHRDLSSRQKDTVHQLSPSRSTGSLPHQPGTADSLERRPATAHGRLSRASPTSPASRGTYPALQQPDRSGGAWMQPHHPSHIATPPSQPRRRQQ